MTTPAKTAIRSFLTDTLRVPGDAGTAVYSPVARITDDTGEFLYLYEFQRMEEDDGARQTDEMCAKGGEDDHAAQEGAD